MSNEYFTQIDVELNMQHKYRIVEIPTVMAILSKCAWEDVPEFAREICSINRITKMERRPF